MKHGFIRCAAATPEVKVADPVYNAEQTWLCTAGDERTCQDHGISGTWADCLYLRRSVFAENFIRQGKRNASLFSRKKSWNAYADICGTCLGAQWKII